jgi:hypothetical protein
MIGTTANLTWPAAVQYCGTQGGRLASIHDDIESNVIACKSGLRGLDRMFKNYYILKLFNFIFFSILAHLTYHRSYFIGGNVNLTQSRILVKQKFFLKKHKIKNI